MMKHFNTANHLNCGIADNHLMFIYLPFDLVTVKLPAESIISPWSVVVCIRVQQRATETFELPKFMLLHAEEV